MIYNKELFDELEKLGWPASPVVVNGCTKDYRFYHFTHKICVSPVERRGPKACKWSIATTPKDDSKRCTMACTHSDAIGSHKIKPIRIDMQKKHWRKHLIAAYTVMVMSIQSLNDINAERNERARLIQRWNHNEECLITSHIAYNLSNSREKSALLFKHLKDNGWLRGVNFTSSTTY